METLPALLVQVTGMVTASNLPEFKTRALAYISNINRDLSTDQDFANAETAVKWCADAESKLDAVKAHALSQTASIDELFRAIDDIKAAARTTRLELDKLVTRRKTEVKEDIVMAARKDYDAHLAALKQETGGAWISIPPPDFGGAIKGKRSIDSINDAVSVTLANAKIAANTVAQSVRANLACIKEGCAGFEFLFGDKSELIGYSTDHLKLVISTRITDHKAKQAARDEAIRAEAQAKAERDVRAKLEAEMQAAMWAEQEKSRAQAAALAEQEHQAASRAQALGEQVRREEQARIAAEAKLAPAAANITHTATKFAAKVQQPGSEPTLKLGEISMRLGFTVTADFLHVLGFDPAKTDRASRLFHESEFAPICQALIAHITEVSEQFDAIAA